MATSPQDMNQPTANEAETRLLQSALSLFSQKGYEGTSIREIIEGAGVTRPVLYYYFENKEDLFRRLVEMKFAEYTLQIQDIIKRYHTAADRLKAVITSAFGIVEQNPEAVRLILQVFFAPPSQVPMLDRNKLARMRFKLIEEIMREGLEKKELSGGDSQSLALVFIGLMDMHIMAKSNREETRLTRDLGENLVDLFIYGAGYREKPMSKLTSPY